jgi:hypothetical protein
VTELFHSQCINYFVQRSARDLLHTNIPGTNGRVSCEWRMVDDAWNRQKVLQRAKRAQIISENTPPYLMTTWGAV